MDEQYALLTRKKDSRMKHIERMTRLCGTVATQIIYRDDLTTPLIIALFIIFLHTSMKVTHLHLLQLHIQYCLE